MLKLDGKDIVDVVFFICITIVLIFLVGFKLGLNKQDTEEITKKAPVKAAPAQTNMYHLIININDLSEEDFEALQEIFRNKGEQ